MNKPQRIAFASIAGFFITAIGILGIGLIVVPVESRSSLFWPRLLWTEFLALLVWSTVFSFLLAAVRRREDDRSVTGVLPGAKLVLIGYSLISFVIMLAQAYIPVSPIGDRLHLAVQIGLAVAAGITFAFLAIVSPSAAIGTDKVFEAGCSPSEIADLLQVNELRVHQFPSHEIWSRIEVRLKALREVVLYSLPQVGSIGTTGEYREFTKSIESVCNLLSAHNDPTDSELGPIQSTIDQLLARGKFLSSRSITR